MIVTAADRLSGHQKQGRTLGSGTFPASHHRQPGCITILAGGAYGL